MPEERTHGLPMLLTGLLAGPVAFLLNLQISYMLVPWACASGRQYTLHLSALLFLLMTIVGGLVSWRVFNGSAAANRRFMGVVGIMVSLMFFLAVLAQGVVGMILGACQ